MLGKTHKAFSVATLSAIGIGYHTFAHQDLVLVVTSSELLKSPIDRIWIALVLLWGALMGASYPDIDQTLPIKHRGITHSLWIAIALIGVYYYASINEWLGPIYTYTFLLPLLFGFIVGYMSHLIADAFSVTGVAWFYPLQRYHRYPNGAEVVKGHRLIFQPLYHVGARPLGISGTLIWTIIAVILTVVWFFTF